MEINTSLDLFSHRSTSRGDRHLFLQKFFKMTAIFVGLVVILLISIDICTDIYRTYKDANNCDKYRLLEEWHEKTIENSILDTNSLKRILEEDNSTITPDKNTTVDFNAKLAKLDEIASTMETEDYIREGISKFYDGVNNNLYRGVWRSEESYDFLDNKTEGQLYLKIEKILHLSKIQNGIYVSFRLLDGEFMDKWAGGKLVSLPMTKVGYYNTSIKIILTGSLECGEIFERTSLLTGKYIYHNMTIRL